MLIKYKTNNRVNVQRVNTFCQPVVSLKERDGHFLYTYPSRFTSINSLCFLVMLHFFSIQWRFSWFTNQFECDSWWMLAFDVVVSCCDHQNRLAPKNGHWIQQKDAEHEVDAADELDEFAPQTYTGIQLGQEVSAHEDERPLGLSRNDIVHGRF